MTVRNVALAAAAVAVLLLVALVALVAVLPDAGPDADAFATASVSSAGDAEVRARLDPDPPRQLGNTAWLHVTRGGAPVTTGVTVEAMMPEMGAMPEMRSRADTTHVGDGVWRAGFDLQMGGGWTLEVTVDGRMAAFAFTVGSRGLVGDGGGAPTVEADGAVRIDPERRQQFGIRTTPVALQPMTLEIRALGRVAWDETRLVDVALTTGGWIRDLRVNETGQRVQRGDALFVLYSPDLFIAEQEWLLALGRGPDDALARAGRRKLELLGLTSRQIDAIAARGEPSTEVPILSPVTGYVVEKHVVEGSSFQPGDPLFRIAPLTDVWIEAEVYSSDLPHVHAGQSATVTLPDLPGATYEATVDLLQPRVGRQEHTRSVRLALANPEEVLLPGMYAEVRLQAPLGDRVVVPDSAVLYAGERRIAFEDVGEGRLVPREITVGARSGGLVEVLSGLDAGDVVVTSGTFLVAAESRLRAATDLWGGSDGAH